MSMYNHIQDNWNKSKVVCKHCGKTYIQRVEDQIPGFRDREYDICPYCLSENGSSMELDFFNSKLED